MSQSTKSVKWNSNGNEIEVIIEMSKSIETATSNADGWVMTVGTKVVESYRLTVYANGKEVSHSNFRPWGSQNYITDDVKIANEDTYNMIIAAIAEAEAEINEASAEQYEALEAAEVEAEEAAIAEWATAVIAEADKRNNILTASEEKAWRRAYNNLHNEGGEYGYIPTRVTQEDVTRARAILKS